MRHLIVILAALLSFGCARSIIQLTDAQGHPVTIEQKMGGRGCLAIAKEADGSIDIVVQQDGSSDWAGVRAIPVLAQTIITTLLGSRGDGEAAFTGPSDIQGCAGIFESVEEEVEE